MIYGERNASSTKLIVLDIDGTYIQTIEIGSHLIDFCYDKANNRIIMNLDDEMQFAYLDLDGLSD